MKYFFLLFLISLLSCKSSIEEVDLVIESGSVYLPDGTTQEQDIIIKNGNIYAMGADMAKNFSSSKSLNAEGNFIMPGFIDAHAHFEGVGNSLKNLNFLGDTTWQSLLNKVSHKVAETEEGKWIVGRGWHQEKWIDQPERSVNGYPAHDELSAISPNHPVFLSHASGHGILVNAKAMELAGIDEHTISPKGGLIVKDENGRPIGIFQENAANLLSEKLAEAEKNKTEEQIKEDWLEMIQLAEQEFLSNGVTSVHDAGISVESIRGFQKLAEENDLDLRLYAMMSQTVANHLSTEELKSIRAFEHPYFNCRSIKAYMDGALGSRGAWLLEDYSDKVGYRGENVTPLSELAETANIAHKHDYQLCIHAIGDKGNREVIDLFEEEMGDKLKNSRWRIEHAQHLHPSDIERIGDLGIIASMQTVHCTSDSPFVEKRLGQKRAEEGAYVWQTLLQNDVHIANGTDAPVEKVNPFENIYAAITRKRPGEKEAFYPKQVLTRQQALDSYTEWNAYAGFDEDLKGSLEAGKLADIVILDQNLLTCDEEKIPTTKVLYTIVGGNIKYQSNKKNE